MGSMVPIICNKSKKRVPRMNSPLIRPSPMRVSQVARMGRLRAGSTHPKLKTSMVRPARSWAGESPGKNFRKPNQKNTIPKLTRKMVRLLSANQRVIRRSMRSSLRESGIPFPPQARVAQPHRVSCPFTHTKRIRLQVYAHPHHLGGGTAPPRRLERNREALSARGQLEQHHPGAEGT